MRKKIFMGMCLSTFLTLVAATIVMALFFAYMRVTPMMVVTLVIFIGIIGAANYGLAFKLADKITESINQIDFTNPDEIEAYDELASFVRTALSHQNQMEDQLGEFSQRAEVIRLVFENMQEGFIMLDPSGDIIMANVRVRNIFEANEDCEGQNINLVIRNIDFLDKVRAALQGHSVQMVLEMEQAYQVSFIPAAQQGAIILISDVTERQLAKKMRRDFLPAISQELNAPLTYIAGFAEMISKGQIETENMIHFAEKIKDEAEGMAEVVENVIFLSDLDEMDGGEDFKQFDAAKVAAEVVEDLRPVAEAAQVELSLSDAPSPIYGNRRLVRAMLINLISNGIRYNKSMGQVRIAVSYREGSGYINVTDTGIGIPKEEQQRVFERFYRIESTQSEEVGGAGLGLAIVKHIVRYHGGTIELESAPGEGTRVFVKLPQE